MIENIIEINELKKIYNKTIAVDNLNFKIQKGQIIGLLGPNGCGKSTTIGMMLGLIKPTSGSVIIKNKNIENNRTNLLEKMNFISPYIELPKKLTVEENLLAVLEALPQISRKERHDRAQKIMVDFDIEHKRNSQGMTLSGGERRRVEIARAVVLKPSIMLLDEPFAGIDPISIGDIRNSVTQLRAADIGVLITDHNVREALAICDRAYIVADGRILAAGKPEEILAHSEVRARYLGSEFRL